MESEHIAAGGRMWSRLTFLHMANNVLYLGFAKDISDLAGCSEFDQ
jgi:hypothetical protein